MKLKIRKAKENKKKDNINKCALQTGKMDTI